MTSYNVYMKADEVENQVKKLCNTTGIQCKDLKYGKFEFNQQLPVTLPSDSPANMSPFGGWQDMTTIANDWSFGGFKGEDHTAYYFMEDAVMLRYDQLQCNAGEHIKNVAKAGEKRSDKCVPRISNSHWNCDELMWCENEASLKSGQFCKSKCYVSGNPTCAEFGLVELSEDERAQVKDDWCDGQAGCVWPAQARVCKKA